MPSTATDRLSGLSASVAVKAPCRVSTTENITLSGLQTVDGIALADGDRVLVKDQTDAVENGIYVARTGAWERAKDFNGNRDAVRGTLVLVQPGTDSALWWVLTTANPVVIGTSEIRFAPGDPNGITAVQREMQTATAGQTLFTLSQITYTPGANTLRVYLNGFRVTDFTETSDTSVTMTSGLSAGDEVLFEAGAGVNAGAASSADLITYTPAGTGAVTTNVQEKLRRMVDALDRGADKTGVADSTAAFNALTTDLRAALVNVDYDYIPYKITIPPGVYSISSWDLTGLLGRRVEIHMHGAVLVARTAGKHVIDGLGSRWLTIHGGVIYSASGVVAKSGIQIGPKGTETCGNNAFHDVYVVGYFASAALMNLGSETTNHYNCTYINRNTSASVYAAIFDGATEFLPTSDYATVTRIANNLLSFTNNSHYSSQFRNEGGGIACYGAKTEGFTFDKGCYYLSFNDATWYLYGRSTHRHSGLAINGQFENSQDNNPTAGNIGIRYCFTFDNDGAAQVIEGFACDAFKPQCETSFMHNAGAGALRISSANIRVQGLNQSGALFFGTSGSIAMEGRIETQDDDKLNLGVLSSFTGTIHVNTAATIASLPALGAWQLFDRTARSVTYGGTHDYTNGVSTFTPTVTFATPGDLSVSYATQTASYAQAGDLIFFTIALTFTPTHTTASGNLRIGGLPATSRNVTSQHFGVNVVSINSAFTWPASATQVVGRVPANANYIELYGEGDGIAATAFTTAHAPSGTAKTLILSGFYMTA